MTKIEVRPVRDRAGLEDFIGVARRAEASNPQWVEQLHDETRQMFDSRKSPFLKENNVQLIVAYRTGEAVGRIVATIDAAHQRKYGDSCGFFGFLESVDEPASFSALFGATEQFLRDHGMTKARGPFGLNVNGESGI